MTALDRFVVMVPGLSCAVHVYAGNRADAKATAAEQLGLRSLPDGSVAIPVNNDHAPRLAA